MTMETDVTMTSQHTHIDAIRTRILKQAGLGERLRSARESMHLSEKEAGARLHLNSKIIALMENEDFENGPPTTFMRGYLRSYARLLNIPDSEINATLTQHETHIAPETISHAVPIMKTRSTHNSHRYLRWMTYVVVSVLVVLVSIWWNKHPKDIITISKPIASINNVAIAQPVKTTPAIPASTPSAAPSPSTSVTAPALSANTTQEAPAAIAPAPAVTAPAAPSNATPTAPVPEVPVTSNATAPEQSTETKAPSNGSDMDMSIPEPGLEQNESSNNNNDSGD